MVSSIAGEKKRMHDYLMVEDNELWDTMSLHLTTEVKDAEIKKNCSKDLPTV